MMPNTSVRPAAIRNSITPSCSPLSICSRIRMKFIGENKKGRGQPAPLASLAARRLPLHLALFFVRILVVREDRLLDLHDGILAGRPRNRLQQVEILDRKVI